MRAGPIRSVHLLVALVTATLGALGTIGTIGATPAGADPPPTITCTPIARTILPDTGSLNFVALVPEINSACTASDGSTFATGGLPPSAPLHGTIDSSFVYHPDPGFVGQDTTSVPVFGTAGEAAAVVFINVFPPPILTPSAITPGSPFIVSFNCLGFATVAVDTTTTPSTIVAEGLDPAATGTANIRIDLPATVGIGDRLVVIAGCNFTSGPTWPVIMFPAFFDVIGPVAPEQLIIFPKFVDIHWGDPAPKLDATATSGLPVSFASLTTQVCRIKNGLLQIIEVGKCAVEADQSGDANFHPAPPVAQSFEVLTVPLTITANDKSHPYKAGNENLTVTYTGFVNGETKGSSDLTGAPTCSTPVTDTSPGGAYPITCTQGTLSSKNYTFTFVDGTFTVTPRTLTVRPKNADRDYGDLEPPIDFSINGFAPGEDLGTSDVTGTPLCTAGLKPSVPVGSYPILCSAGSLSSNDYTFAFKTATEKVTKATLTVTADPQKRPAGQPNPPLTTTITGFTGGDVPPADVTGAPNCNTSAGKASKAGTYAIHCTKGTLASSNYQFTFVSGILTVT